MNLPRYSDGTLIEKGDAVLRSDVVPARILDVFEGNPPSVWLEDAEHPGRSFATAVSYTHLDVYKRQVLCQRFLRFVGGAAGNFVGELRREIVSTRQRRSALRHCRSKHWQRAVKAGIVKTDAHRFAGGHRQTMAHDGTGACRPEAVRQYVGPEF